MFSGIVEGKGAVERIETPNDAALRLILAPPFPADDIRLGDSICVEGVCLTVVAVSSSGALSFEIAEETLRKTTLGEFRVGEPVNMERSLSLADRVHGHFVFGHVDGRGTLVGREADGATERLTFSAPSELIPLIAPKGSITISGVSLTVGEVTDDRFSVYIVPHTSAVTTLSRKGKGDSVNLEIDMLARYVERLLSARFSTHGAPS